MKKYFVLILAVALTGLAFGQEENPDKALRKAGRNIANYNLDPSDNADKLDEAEDLITMVVQHPEHKQSSKAWHTYGQVYAERVNQDVQALVLNPEHQIQHADAPGKVWDGYSKAYNYAEKNYEKKDALKGMQDIINNLTYLANVILRTGNYAEAYDAYNAVIKGDAFLMKNGGESAFETEQDRLDQVYLAALAALSAEMYSEAGELFTKLYEKDYDSPAIYEGLYKVCSEEGKEEAAYKVLVEGREKYPEDKGLLFAEINAALAKGDLEALVDKLQLAMEQEPDNVTVPTTLGNVYDQLYQKATEEGDSAKAAEYYSNARKYLQKALSIDPDYFDATYLMGALEYNKAAELATRVNELADDYSPEGTKKYEAAKAEMMDQFEKALPYFKNAEALKPNDVSTLIALREIYARQNKLELSAEYKAKIESIETGQENE